MRIAAHPWQETLGATPAAISKIGGQVDETDTFRIPRLRREKIPAAQTRGSRAFIPVAAARTNDEERSERTGQRQLAAITQAVGIRVICGAEALRRRPLQRDAARYDRRLLRNRAIRG